MTASPISDLNPVFMAARCTLMLAKAGGIKSLFFFFQYMISSLSVPISSAYIQTLHLCGA